MKCLQSVDPIYILNLGEVKLNSFKQTWDEFNLKNLGVSSIHLSDQYFFIKLSGRTRNPKPRYTAEELVWYNRQTGSVVLSRTTFQNDMDGVDEVGIYYPPKNGGFWDYVNVVDAKPFVEEGSVNVEDLATPKYYGKLKELLAESDIEDNPIIRIFHLK